MKFPATLKATEHKHGGRVLCVYGISHACDKPEDGRSRDYWWYIGDVQWDDGTISKKTEIAPYAVCYSDEAGRDEVLALSEAMSDYLHKHGTWCDRASRHEGWYANERPTQKRRRA